VVRRFRGRPFLCAVRPKSDVLALPKGHPDGGESMLEAATREVREETGLVADPVEKLGDVRYWYVWERERVLKVVSFFLFRYRSGRLGEIPPEHAHEVAEVRWLPLEDAPELLAYKGEREMAAKALARLGSRA
jgi:8-oxo-dGTP pyrophosphatase MutT (NUDIX family)